MLLAWPCLLGTGSEVIRGAFRLSCGDVGVSSEVPSEGPNRLSSTTPGGMVWASGPRLRRRQAVFALRPPHVRQGKGGPVPAAQYPSDAEVRGPPPACAHL